MIASLDPRVPAYGARMHHPYGGRCLPKSIQHLLKIAEGKLGKPAAEKVPVLAGVSKWAVGDSE